MPHLATLAGFAPWIPLAVLVALAPIPPQAPQALQVFSLSDREIPDPEPGAVVLRVVEPSDVPAHGIGSFLMPGDEVAPTGAERVLLLTRGGELVQVEGGETLEVSEEGMTETDPLFRLLRALLREAMVLSDSSAGLPAATPPLPLGDGAEPALPLRPTGDRLVRSLTPRMQWQPEAEAMGYRIHLWESDGSLISVEAGTEAGTEAGWTLPPEAALNPGARYEWAVEPRPGDRISPRASFHVASREILDELAQELGKLRQRGLDPDGDGRLPAAAIFRSMGFPYDAMDTLEALAATGDPLAPEVQDFRRRLVEELGSSDTQGAFSR
ncbi:MAG: hypothetical protein EA422_02850 [Gemmatimonadales bacterium]|nr:MAG: hypothetical protein EA422_02850 [Gemmatimonadales bacterium]